MILAIASGKGGTGKTTVSVNLARALGRPVQILDCDVEEPNAHLFLRAEKVREEVVSLLVPRVEEALCDGCGECGRFCQYHAIVSFGTVPILFDEMCHGCGGCASVCPQKAIREIERRIGVVEWAQDGDISLVQGRLDVGVAMAPPLIRAVKAQREQDLPAILDAPPGTSCPVVSTIRGSDFALLVTEPTPFGLHDLKLAVATIREIGVPFGVAVNRVGIGDEGVHRYCDGEKIPILFEIPDDRRIAEAYSQGRLIVEALPEYRALFEGFARDILPVIESGRN